jgi:hypothetical protein
MYGIPGYDDLVPDDSEEGAQAWRAEAGRSSPRPARSTSDSSPPADAVTLDCTKEAATQELAIIDMARAEHPVTALPYAGPATFLAVAARTVLTDPGARVARSGGVGTGTPGGRRAGGEADAGEVGRHPQGVAPAGRPSGRAGLVHLPHAAGRGRGRRGAPLHPPA